MKAKYLSLPYPHPYAQRCMVCRRRYHPFLVCQHDVCFRHKHNHDGCRKNLIGRLYCKRLYVATCRESGDALERVPGNKKVLRCPYSACKDMIVTMDDWRFLVKAVVWVSDNDCWGYDAEIGWVGKRFDG